MVKHVVPGSEAANLFTPCNSVREGDRDIGCQCYAWKLIYECFDLKECS